MYMSFLAAILLKNEHFFLLSIRHIAPAVLYCVLTKRQERAFVLIFHHYRTKFKHPLYQQSCTPAKSGRRGWLTPVLPHHRSCGPASGGSVTGTRQHVWSEIVALSDSALPSVAHLSSGRHPLSSNCFQHARFLTCCITSNRRALPSTGFHQFLRYYGPD